MTRVDPANPSGTGLPDVTTAADGSFGIADTPPVTGTFTYQISYAGGVHPAAFTASVTLRVGRWPAGGPARRTPRAGHRARGRSNPGRRHHDYPMRSIDSKT